MTENIRKTRLYEVHKQTAKLTLFSGFKMPLWYKGISKEHLAVRNNVGIFDISHMGRTTITGIDSKRFLNHVITNDVSLLSKNSCKYSVMCNECGGIIDDFVVYMLEVNKFMLVSNATNREKDFNWLMKKSEGFDVKLKDVSEEITMLAVQGPKSEQALQKICKADLNKVGRFKGSNVSIKRVKVFLSRTGYTGEDGFEIFIDNIKSRKNDEVKIWNAILKVGKAFGIEKCGLAARDTLRLEAGMCLYGNDIDENTNPLEARLGFVVKLQKDEFIGKNALLKLKDEGIKRKRVGILITEQGIPRNGFEIYDYNNNIIGSMTSGTFSPLLKRAIGMGYIFKSHTQERSVKIKIRNKLIKGKIVSFPFYDTKKYGYSRKAT